MFIHAVYPPFARSTTIPARNRRFVQVKPQGLRIGASRFANLCNPLRQSDRAPQRLDLHPVYVLGTGDRFGNPSPVVGLRAPPHRHRRLFELPTARFQETGRYAPLQQESCRVQRLLQRQRRCPTAQPLLDREVPVRRFGPWRELPNGLDHRFERTGRLSMGFGRDRFELPTTMGLELLLERLAGQRIGTGFLGEDELQSSPQFFRQLLEVPRLESLDGLLESESLRREAHLELLLRRRTHRLASCGGRGKVGRSSGQSTADVPRISVPHELRLEQRPLLDARNPPTGQQVQDVAHDRPPPGLPVVPDLQPRRHIEGQLR